MWSDCGGCISLRWAARCARPAALARPPRLTWEWWTCRASMKSAVICPKSSGEADWPKCSESRRRWKRRRLRQQRLKLQLNHNKSIVYYFSLSLYSFTLFCKISSSALAEPLYVRGRVERPERGILGSDICFTNLPDELIFAFKALKRRLVTASFSRTR